MPWSGSAGPGNQTPITRIPGAASTACMEEQDACRSPNREALRFAMNGTTPLLYNPAFCDEAPVIGERLVSPRRLESASNHRNGVDGVWQQQYLWRVAESNWLVA